MSQALLQLEDIVLMATLLGLGGLHLIGGGGGLPLGLLHGVGRVGQLPGHTGTLLLQPLQLVGPAQNTRAAGGRAAGHGAAGVEHLAVQGNDLEAVVVFPGHGNGLVHILGHHRAAQQIGKDLLIPGVKLDEFVAQAHEAGLLSYPLVPEVGRPHGGQGQEGAPPAVPAFQVLDGSFAVLLPLHYDVLHGAPQGDLNGHRAGVGYMDQPRHRAVDTPELAFLGLPHHQLHRFGVALIHLFHLGEHMDAGVEGIVLHLELDVALLRLLGLPLPGLHPQGIAANDVL